MGGAHSVRHNGHSRCPIYHYPLFFLERHDMTPPSASPAAALRALINPFWVLSCRILFWACRLFFVLFFFLFLAYIPVSELRCPGFYHFFAFPFLASWSGVFIFASLVTSHPFVNFVFEKPNPIRIPLSRMRKYLYPNENIFPPKV